MLESPNGMITLLDLGFYTTSEESRKFLYHYMYDKGIYIIGRELFFCDIQRWLRETFNYNINVSHRTHSQTHYITITSNYDKDIDTLYSGTFEKHKSYVLALRKGIEECIKIITNEKS